MYYADSVTREIRYCDYDPHSGAIGASRVFVAADAAPGEPDGSCIDAEGCLWTTRWGAGQVMRFTPDGRLDRVLALAAPQPSCPAFGGAGLSTLYLSSARLGMTAGDRLAAPLSGAMFHHELDVQGLPESRFLGRFR
jgi:L-arabinonolactonase